MNKALKFNRIYLLSFVAVFGLMASCSSPQGYSKEAVEVDTLAVDSETAAYDDPVRFFSGTYADEWDHFRFAIIEGREFDWDKFVWIEGQSGWDYAWLFDDDYTKSVLAETTYDKLDEKLTEDGFVEKEFWVVVVNAEGQPEGHVFTFRETSYGLAMTGFLAYE